ncbi:MAG: hypothetical protein J0H99_15090, partial [Rhodospirillales bacterium]|nr:hypothetical protein [Rhodospirillales bacterium]
YGSEASTQSARQIVVSCHEVPQQRTPILVAHLDSKRSCLGFRAITSAEVHPNLPMTYRR